MDKARSKMVNLKKYQKPAGQLILEALRWLNDNKQHRDDQRGGKTNRATIYNDVLVRMYRRIIDNTKDNEILIKFYEWAKKVSIDEELKQTLLDFLAKKGKKSELVYFTDTETIKKWLQI